MNYKADQAPGQFHSSSVLSVFSFKFSNRQSRVRSCQHQGEKEPPSQCGQQRLRGRGRPQGADQHHRALPCLWLACGMPAPEMAPGQCARALSVLKLKGKHGIT